MKAKVQFNLDELKVKHHGESPICLLRKGRDQAAQPELWVGRSFCGHTQPLAKRGSKHTGLIFRVDSPMLTFIKKEGWGVYSTAAPRTVIQKSHPLSYLHLLTRAWGRSEKTKTSSFLSQDPLPTISS